MKAGRLARYVGLSTLLASVTGTTPTWAQQAPSAAPSALPPVQPATVPAAVPATYSQPPPADEFAHRDGSRNLRSLGWIGIGVGATGLAIAIVTSVLLLQAKSERDADCTAQKKCTQPGLDAVSRISSTVAVNAASWVVGVAGVGVGYFLVKTNPSDAPHETAMPAGGGLTVKAVF